MSRFFLIPAILVLAAPLAGISQEKEERSGSLGDLLNKVKDIKVPDSVSNLPAQITELKESYIETAKTVEELRIEVDQLRDEVYELRKENEVLREAVGEKVKTDELGSILKPEEISATNLVGAFRTDGEAADKQYKNRYLKVVGTIDSFETGSSGIILALRSDTAEAKVRCSFQSGPEFFVDVLPAQGRLISRNDRRTLLTVGQPVAVLGTCTGAALNVDMINCRIEGFVEKRKEDPPEKKK